MVQNGKTELQLVEPKFLTAQEAEAGAGGSRVISPMPGVLDKLMVQPGDVVKSGDALAVIIGRMMTD